MANLGANDFGRDLELNDLDIDLGCDPPISPSKDKNYSEADKIESKMFPSELEDEPSSF